MNKSLRTVSTKASILEAGSRAEKLFEQESRELTLRNVKMLCVIAMILVPACSLLDHFVYPEHFWDFFLLRWTCVPVLMCTFFLTSSRWGKQNFGSLTLFVTMVPAFFIAVMITLSGDPASSYYAGLTLCLVAIGLIFHWTYRQALTASLLVLAMYLAAAGPLLLGPIEPRLRGLFIGNCMFIMMNGVVLISGSIFHHKIRLKEFKARHELDESRAKLQNTLVMLKDNEAQLVQSEKLASLGQMSAGIIHEINNPLNYANSAIFLLRKKVSKITTGDTGRVTEIIDDIQDGLTRVSTIVSELRDFSHPNTNTEERANVQSIIRSASRLASKSLGTNDVTVTVDCPEDLEVLANKNQLVQVLINLLLNAVDAFEQAEDRQIHIGVSANGDTADIIIRDNGSGIPAEHMSKLFDPFFTTKDVGSGTGLGLSICYHIIQDNKGSIKVTSEPGKFTEFHITLRTTGAKTTPVQKPDAEPALAN